MIVWAYMNACKSKQKNLQKYEYHWQIIGMHTTGMSFKAIGRQMGYHYTVVSRLVRKHTQPDQCERLAKIRKTTGNIWSWRQGIAAFGWMDAIRNQSRTQTTVAAQ
jgi:hypothetical protein